MSAPVDAELLADPADLAALTGLSVDDPRLRAALLGASRRFAGAVRHPVRLIEADETVLDGNGTATLILPAAPVTTVSVVELAGVALTPDEYAWSADGLLERDSGWPRARRNVRVIWSHGYDPIPGAVSDVVLQAAHIALNTEAGLSSVSVGGVSMSFATGANAAQGATEVWADVVASFRINRGDR